jgi:hypothetical protein
MNILEQEDIVKGMPDEVLVTQSQNPTGGIPQFLLVSEIQRREKMRASYQGEQQQMPMPTVADQVVQQGIASLNPAPDPLMNTAMGAPQQPMMPQQARMTAAGGGMMPYRMATGRDAPSIYDMLGVGPEDLTAEQVVARYPDLFELGIDESTGRPMSVFKGPTKRRDPRELLNRLLAGGSKYGGVVNPEQAQELLQGINFLSGKVGSSTEDFIADEDLSALKTLSNVGLMGGTNKYGTPLTQLASGPAKEDASRMTARQVTPELIQYAQAPNTADAGVPDGNVVEGEVKEFADAFPNMRKVYKNKQPLGVMLSDADGPDPVDKARVKKLIDFSLFPKAVAAEQESLGVLQKDIDPTDPKINQAQIEGFFQAAEERRKRRTEPAPTQVSGGPYSRGFGLTQERTKGGFDALIKAAERDAKRNRQDSSPSTTDSSITPSDNVPLGEGTLTRRGIRRRIPSSNLPEIFDEGQIEGFLQATEDRRIARLEKNADQSSEATTPSEFIDNIIKERGLAPSGADQSSVNEEEIIESAKTSSLPGILGADPVLGGLALARLGAGIAQGDIGKGLIGATDVVLQENKLTREEEKDKALMDLYKERAALAKRTDPNRVKGQDLSYYIKIVQNQQPVDPLTGEPKVLDYGEVIRQAQILQMLDTGDLDRDKAIGQLSMEDALGGGSQVSQSFENKRQEIEAKLAGL